MTLNCRAGDIARIVDQPLSLRELQDRFVTCKELVYLHGEAFWRFDRPTEFTIQGACRNVYTGKTFDKGQKLILYSAPDKYLRPFRYRGGEDEVLRIAGKPNQVDETLRPKRQVEFSR